MVQSPSWRRSEAACVAFCCAALLLAAAGAARAAEPPPRTRGTIERLDGDTLKAIEVHVFPENMRGAGDGHYPWDLDGANTMTNGAVARWRARADAR